MQQAMSNLISEGDAVELVTGSLSAHGPLQPHIMLG